MVCGGGLTGIILQLAGAIFYVIMNFSSKNEGKKKPHTKHTIYQINNHSRIQKIPVCAVVYRKFCIKVALLLLFSHSWIVSFSFSQGLNSSTLYKYHSFFHVAWTCTWILIWRTYLFLFVCCRQHRRHRCAPVAFISMYIYVCVHAFFGFSFFVRSPLSFFFWFYIDSAVSANGTRQNQIDYTIRLVMIEFKIRYKSGRNHYKLI